MSRKPDHLGPEYASQFQDESVARAYKHRPPYSSAFFDVLRTLQSSQVSARILELGSGTGDATLGLVSGADSIDAIEPSAAMLSIAQCRPGGDAPRIRWVHATSERAEFRGPYSLALAAESLHWMDWDVVVPKVATALAPGAFLVIAERDSCECPWSDELTSLVAKYSTNRVYRPYDLIAELTSRGLFREVGRCTTLPAVFSQSIEDHIELMHSRNGFSRERMPPNSAREFDASYRQLLERNCTDGVVRLRAVSRIVWGIPESVPRFKASRSS